MGGIHRGRFTAAVDEEVVLFRIGMRINRLWKVHRWWPVASAMPRMLQELFAQPELGLLHAEYAWSGRTITVSQWWASFDQLDAYARAPDHEHLPAWRAFNRAVRDSGDVGIFHETYRVRPGDVESIYGNMPEMGLAAATSHQPVGRVAQAARARMDPGVPDEPVVDPY